MKQIAWMMLAAVVCAGCDDAGDGSPDADAAVDATPAGWAPAFDAADTGALLSVWGPAPDDVWAVGGQPELGVAWHYDGAAWTRADTPDGPLLNWVHGARADDVWFVGEEGRILRRQGGAWREVLGPTEHALWGVWAAAPDDVWAVGGDAAESAGEPDPVLLHFDGEAWNRHVLPEVDRPYRALFKVWGTRADHVFAVGSNGVILHYDGTEWTAQGSGVGDDLISLWGRADDDIVAVGGRSNGVVARWDGSAWTSEKLAGVPGLNGVWMAADGVATLVGLRGRVVTLQPGGFDHEAQPSGTTLVLHGVYGSGDGTRITVGGSLGERPPWEGVALWTHQEGEP